MVAGEKKYTERPKKHLLKIYRKDWIIFSKTVFKILRLVLYPRHLKNKLKF